MREHGTRVAIERINSQRAARSSLREDDCHCLVCGWMSARREDRQCGGGRGRREQIVSRSSDRDHKLDCAKRRRAGHGRPPPPRHRQQSTQSRQNPPPATLVCPLARYVLHITWSYYSSLTVTHFSDWHSNIYLPTTVCLQARPRAHSLITIHAAFHQVVGPMPASG